jgi:hypothetical protein
MTSRPAAALLAPTDPGRRVERAAGKQAWPAARISGELGGRFQVTPG